jgi:hypothetical protein
VGRASGGASELRDTIVDSHDASASGLVATASQISDHAARLREVAHDALEHIAGVVLVRWYALGVRGRKARDHDVEPQIELIGRRLC